MTLSLSVVLLGAMAGTASAGVTVSPAGTDFGDRQVGTTSPPQAFTLTAACNKLSGVNLCAILNQPFTFSPSIATSGEFQQTNDCPPTLSTFSTAGVSCIINVTFTPTSTGSKAGSLTTGCASCTAPLTGNGVTTSTPPTPPTPAPTPPSCKGDPPTIVGTAGANQLVGTSADDVIVALGGNDTVSGLAGDDVICGGAGKDKLKGGAGPDILLGEAGKDALKGGGGADLCKGGKGKDTASACEIQKSI